MFCTPRVVAYETLFTVCPSSVYVQPLFWLQRSCKIERWENSVKSYGFQELTIGVSILYSSLSL